jgi:hypothetical protein
MAILDSPLFARPDPPDDGEAENRPGDRDQRGEQVRVAQAPARGGLDDRAEYHGSRRGTQQGADDSLPEAVRDEDREVPEGKAHREPDDHCHR